MINRRCRCFKSRCTRLIEKYEISMESLKQKQGEGAIIVDVRSLQEYNEGHIDGAINIPEYKINSRIDTILKDRDAEYILYCSYGGRSKKARSKLINLGYQNIYNLYGGLENW